MLQTHKKGCIKRTSLQGIYNGMFSLGARGVTTSSSETVSIWKSSIYLVTGGGIAGREEVMFCLDMFCGGSVVR